MRKLKPKFLLGISLAFISFQAFLGAICGYLLTNFLAGKEAGQPGRIRSIIFKIKNWRIHLHHWLIALAMLNIFLFYQLPPFPQFSLGFLGGMFFQGISRYPDWFKVITKIR